jgi:hypothetical protein
MIMNLANLLPTINVSILVHPRLILAISFFLFIQSSIISQNLLVDWQQCQGGSKNDMGHSMATTSNGYMLFCGTDSHDGQVTYNHGNGDFWLVRSDTLGAIFWSKTYGGSEIEQTNRRFNIS